MVTWKPSTYRRSFHSDDRLVKQIVAKVQDDGRLSKVDRFKAEGETYNNQQQKSDLNLSGSKQMTIFFKL